MNMGMIEERLKSIICSDDFGVQEADIFPHSRLTEDFDLDSLDQIELIMEIENEFDIELSDDQASGIRTFQDAVNMIKEVVGGQS